MFLEDMRTLVYLVAVACMAALLFLCARWYKQHQEGVGEGRGRKGRPPRWRETLLSSPGKEYDSLKASQGQLCPDG